MPPPLAVEVRDRAGQKKTLTLAAPLGKGGAGTVYAVRDQPGLAVKLYSAEHVQTHARKVAHMVANPPQLDHDTLAWPLATVHDPSDSVVGLVMPRIDTQRYAVNLFDVCSRVRREVRGLPMAWSVSVTVGVNLCILVSALHEAGYWIIDFNPSNFLLDRGRFLLIDCDGFSVAGLGAGFLSTQYCAGYACPETVGQRDCIATRGVHQDRFALAVVLFRLLNRGLHPTAGLYTAAPSSEQAKLDGGFLPHRRDAPRDHRPHPRSLFLSLPRSVRRLFEQAFDAQAVEERPSAARWRDALLRTLRRLSTCSVDPEHARVDGYCLACRR